MRFFTFGFAKGVWFFFFVTTYKSVDRSKNRKEGGYFTVLFFSLLVWKKNALHIRFFFCQFLDHYSHMKHNGVVRTTVAYTVYFIRGATY